MLFYSACPLLHIQHSICSSEHFKTLPLVHLPKYIQWMYVKPQNLRTESKDYDTSVYLHIFRIKIFEWNISIKMDVLVSIFDIVTSQFEHKLMTFIELKLHANLELFLNQFRSQNPIFKI